MSVQAPVAQRTVSAGAAAATTVVQLLLLLTFFVAYLNAILRIEYDSIFTGFRVLLPVTLLIVGIRYARFATTRRFAAYAAIAIGYYLVQMMLLGLWSDPFVLSYAINIIALIFFIYFVRIYLNVFGAHSLYGHLHFWYLVLIVASIHQLLTGVAYPIVPNLPDQTVARIFFGQENDTSLAIAAFLPMLFDRVRRSPLALLLLVAGFVVIYMNSTRGIVIAILMYPFILMTASFATRIGRRLRTLSIVVALLTVFAISLGVYFLRDVQFEIIGDDEASLAEMVVDPLTEIASGQTQDAELTSINLRVTTIIVGLQEYAATWGLGVGPGASTHFVRAYYPDIAGSMHVFALQMLTESGWLFVVTMIAILRYWGPRLGYARFLPRFIYYVLITLSITGGAITNYYYFACAVFALTTAGALDARRSSNASYGVRAAPTDQSAPA